MLTIVASLDTRLMSSSRVRRMRFLSPETMQRSKTWIMVGSSGRLEAAARILANKDGRNNVEPGFGRLSGSMVVTMTWLAATSAL